MRPFFSILTPAYNREDFLPKLIDSLASQDFKNFEWVIGNDGSTDDTHKLITSKSTNLSFPVTYIKSSLRIGKSMMDNLLLENCSGKFLLWCDSDDYLLNNSLSKFFSILSEIKEVEDKNFIGILAINNGSDGVMQTHFKNNKSPISGEYVWNDLEKVVSGDGTIVARKSLFSGQRFPEVDFLTIESVLLRNLFKNKRIYFLNEIVKIMDRSAENSISHGKKLQYCRGSSLAIAKALDVSRFADLAFKHKIKSIVNYIRYSVHGDLSITSQIRQWPLLKNALALYIFLFPIAHLICIRDRLLNKVEKTHIEFKNNVMNTKISFKKYNNNINL